MNYNVTSLIKSELANLSESRGLFHSEADFQHELALCLIKNELVRGVRLERPFYANTKRIELDIFVLMSNLKIGIELKYKTRKLITTLNNEIYHIKNQAALGQMRYDYIKDIRRLEALKGINEIDVGYALILTNIPPLWKNGNSPRYTQTEVVWAKCTEVLPTVLKFKDSRLRTSALYSTLMFSRKWMMALRNLS